MAERVTQIAVEVLRKGYSKAQMYQQHVEVLRETDGAERVTQIAVEVLRESAEPGGSVQPVAVVIMS